MKTRDRVDILVVGAGIAGIATAYYLCTRHGRRSVLLVDPRPPLSFTSAQSGDNYRNWWPHPTMTAFTNLSIDLLEEIARGTANAIDLTRRGYLLATREDRLDELVAGLRAGYRGARADAIRVHDRATAASYIVADSGAWETAPRGVDVLANRELIRRRFPSLAEDVTAVLHVRRGGDLNSQQLGHYMLKKIRSAGGERLVATVRGIAHARGFLIDVEGTDGRRQLQADVVVNAAGPFAGDVAAMLGVNLPIENVYQQKLAFDDRRGAIPRRLPFAIDLDAVTFDWTDEERALLADDPDTAWLAGPLPGGTHCRPDGGEEGSRVKLGWAFNRDASKPRQDLADEPRRHPQFPEIVMRAAARLQPALQPYVDDFPARFSHYGGYYSMTPENWPLIGPLGVDGAYVVGALSGFGSMAACAAGSLCADWIGGGELPDYAAQLGMARYDDRRLMAELAAAPSRGVL